MNFLMENWDYLLSVFILVLGFIFADNLTDGFVRVWRNYPLMRYLPDKQFSARAWILRVGVVIMIGLLIFLRFYF